MRPGLRRQSPKRPAAAPSERGQQPAIRSRGYSDARQLEALFA